MAVEDPFIGRGWRFPPRFRRDRDRGSVVMTEARDEIEQSLRVIFSTALGERLMRPDFGAGLDGEVFAPMNATRLAVIEQRVRDAILFHEHRIDADRVRVTADQPAGRLLIEIGYRVRGANSRFNMVFPYDLNGAADGG